MPEGIPRNITAEDVIKAFERAGGVRRQGKGSHVSIKMPNGQLVTIPYHTSVKAGLLRAAIKKAGLTVDELVELIRR